MREAVLHTHSDELEALLASVIFPIIFAAFLAYDARAMSKQGVLS